MDTQRNEWELPHLRYALLKRACRLVLSNWNPISNFYFNALALSETHKISDPHRKHSEARKTEPACYQLSQHFCACVFEGLTYPASLPSMPEPTDNLEFSDQSWERLSTCLRAFSAAWESGAAIDPEAPTNLADSPTSPTLPLSQFIPTGNEILRNIALIELSKLDMQYRAESPAIWFLPNFKSVIARTRMSPRKNIKHDSLVNLAR